MRNDVMSRKRKRKQHPLRVLTSAIGALLLLLCCVVTLNDTMQAPFIPTWDELFVQFGLKEDVELPNTQLRMKVFDVGNADAILLQNGDRFALIDAGERDDGDELVSFFQRAGITRLDYVIATHPDSDHIGGMADVVNGVEIGTFLMPYMPDGYTPTTRVYEDLLLALVDKRITPIDPSYGDSFTFGDARIDILSGLSESTETNDQSIVCRIVFGNHRFLMMGDAGKDVEKELLGSGVDLRADVLKVGHHGSRSSSTKAFIQAVSPRYALITCGLGNSYNHPHGETMNVLRGRNIDIYRSDMHGEITLVSDGQTITIQTEKEGI